MEAAARCLHDRADVSMSAIARAADVSRVTLHTHFTGREALVAAALDHAAQAARQAFDDVSQVGRADEVLTALIRSSWMTLGRYRYLISATVRGQRERHGTGLDRVTRLIARGQAEGVFRTDLPTHWLSTVFSSIVDAAAREVEVGRLAVNDVPAILDSTLRAMFAPSGITG
ncbi:helix-turn-helix transcriptional regulator [Actinokineospora sp. HBU206404]|uniref:Helix-turn-helix transcriptional regulator n=1 Tax=Actinokineospora xionganensis TaxID=2684470 RepID=A0ABR7L0M5_9PSEU|nr:helix-turn-helix transcriptional regulator [Actinokineospora xionganensis]